MLFDVRTYTCRPGTIKLQLEMYEKLGLTPQTRHLGQPFAFFVTETGPINTYIHIWAYESAADRETKRAGMQADPEWQAYLKASGEAGYLIGQQNQLMTPASFFKIKR
ncbi:MAG: NIPSNAP family protein [Alphaproteobacteria bacterium]|nr:NIPSNAP family protein [Alphaproteobacteria bacterium]